jgi:NADP-dependent 3-hydroxy acid dehydrogenase YdfG
MIGAIRSTQRFSATSGPGKTAIVTGASQGIGAGIVKGFAERGFNVVANSRKVTQSTEVAASNHVALVDGHVGEPATAARIVETALSRFKSIDALVNNAGIFFTKPFTDYTAEDIKSLVSTNIEGFLYLTQMVVKQLLAQKTGGSIVTITAALAANPIAGCSGADPGLLLWRYGIAAVGTLTCLSASILLLRA